MSHLVVEIIPQLDLSELTRQYTGRGSAAHHPAVLLGLLIYGYASGVHSSREIERATYDSVAFPYFAADTHPHHEYPSFPARERTWHPPVCSHAGDDARGFGIRHAGIHPGGRNASLTQGQACRPSGHGIPTSASASNPCENAIRPFVVGKRNFLFCDTLAGANASAILYSLVETCKASDVDPCQYLVALFMALPHAQTADDYEAYYPEGSSPQPTRGYRRLPQGTSSRPLTLNARHGPTG